MICPNCGIPLEDSDLAKTKTGKYQCLWCGFTMTKAELDDLRSEQEVSYESE